VFVQSVQSRVVEDDLTHIPTMWWFPSGRDNGSGWRFDAVGLLAVIGEATLEHQAQPLTSTWLCLLPRLIPAPQVLLKSKRPTRLPAKQAVIVGVYSGTRIDELNFYPNLIHPLGSLRHLEVREYTITRRSGERDIESRATEVQSRRKLVFVRLFAPLNIITIISFLATLLLIVWSCLIHDAVAAIALGLMALTSFLAGWGLWWDPELSIRPTNASVVAGDVVIRSREGAFIVVHCSEEIARELYTGTEEAKYRLGNRSFKALVGIATLALMIAVVLLGNCSWTMQAAVGITYIVLNGAYWVAALLPERWTWDISHYKVDRNPEQTGALARQEGDDGIRPNYTRTLWYTVQATKQIGWITTSGAAPNTDAWKKWLQLAYQNCNNPSWDAIGEKDRLMREHVEEIQGN
jgi:hypothetical protein